jgi:hypothetical protein
MLSRRRGCIEKQDHELRLKAPLGPYRTATELAPLPLGTWTDGLTAHLTNLLQVAPQSFRDLVSYEFELCHALKRITFSAPLAGRIPNQSAASFSVASSR